jgi:hypothetical protein
MMAGHRQLALAVALCGAAALLAAPAAGFEIQTRSGAAQWDAVSEVLSAGESAVGSALDAAAVDNVNYITLSESDSATRYRGSFIAPSCIALFKLFSAISAKGGNTTTKSFQITVQLPCQSSSVGGKNLESWSQPNYNCFTASTDPMFKPTGGNLGIFFNPYGGGSLTINAYTRQRNCDLRNNVRPILYGGTRTSLQLPIILLGQDSNGVSPERDARLTASIQNIVVRGSTAPDGTGTKVRGGIAAAGLTSLTLANIDISSAYAMGQGAALELVDTPTRFRCTKSRFCNLYTSYTAANPTTAASNYPGGGGALAVISRSIDPALQASWIDFSGNVHEALGGAFLVIKQFDGVANVAITNSKFTANAAPYGAGGATLRQDTYAQPKSTVTTNCTTPGNYVPYYGLKLALNLGTPNAPANTIYKWTGNVGVDRTVLLGMQAAIIQNPCPGQGGFIVINPAQLPVSGATTVRTNVLLAADPNALTVPAAFASLVFPEYGYYAS